MSGALAFRSLNDCTEEHLQLELDPTGHLAGWTDDVAVHEGRDRLRVARIDAQEMVTDYLGDGPAFNEQ